MSNRQRSLPEVQNILDDYHQSGLSVPEYCSRHNLNAGTFHWWLFREKRNGNKRASRQSATVSPFIQLNQAQPTIRPAPIDSRQEMRIEIELHNGVRTRIQTALSFLQLSELLTACAKISI
jgi:transposase-like protein